MRCKAVPIAALIALTLVACGEAPDNHPDKPVTHRRDAFQKILKAFEPMGIELRKNRYNADQFITQSRDLAARKDGPWPYFGAGTNYPPTHANDKVWSEPEKFEAARQAFIKAADNLVAAADSRDEKQVTVAYEALHDTCRDCHKAFKK